MMETITVWHNGFGLIVQKVVADRLNIQDGHRAETKKDVLDIIRANASYLMSIVEHRAEAEIKKN